MLNLKKSMLVLTINAFLSRLYKVRRVHNFPKYEIAELVTFFCAYVMASYAHSSKTVDICLLGYVTCLAALVVNLNMSGIGFLLSASVFAYDSGLKGCSTTLVV